MRRRRSSRDLEPAPALLWYAAHVAGINPRARLHGKGAALLYLIARTACGADAWLYRLYGEARYAFVFKRARFNESYFWGRRVYPREPRGGVGRVLTPGERIHCSKPKPPHRPRRNGSGLPVRFEEKNKNAALTRPLEVK